MRSVLRAPLYPPPHSARRPAAPRRAPRRTYRNDPSSTPRFELEATLARDAILASTPDREKRVFRTGQLAVLLMALRVGRFPMDYLLFAGADKGVSLDEIRTKMLRPLQREGFVRVLENYVYVTVGAARHPDPIGAWMRGESMDDKRAIKVVKPEEIRSDDVLFMVPRLGYRGTVYDVNRVRRRIFLGRDDEHGEWMDAPNSYLVARASS